MKGQDASMAPSEAIAIYFRGERDTGAFVVVFGLAVLGFAAWVLRSQQGAFRWSLAVPLLLIGLGGAVGGAVLAVRSTRQADSLAALQRSDPQRFVSEECPRMARVNANWPRLKLAWAVIAAICAAVLVLVKRDGVTGAALVMLWAMGLLMLLDTFAERRAAIYSAELAKLPGCAPNAPD
jgi:hypothetical protein